jgi:hypothetical protein
MRISQIYHHIMKQPEILTEQEVEKLNNIIKANNLPPKQYKMLSYEPEIHKIYEDLLIKENIVNETLEIIPEYIKRSKEELKDYIKQVG